MFAARNRIRHAQMPVVMRMEDDMAVERPARGARHVAVWLMSAPERIEDLRRAAASVGAQRRARPMPCRKRFSARSSDMRGVVREARGAAR